MNVGRLSRWSWLLQAGRCGLMCGLAVASVSLNSVGQAADSNAAAQAKTDGTACTRRVDPAIQRREIPAQYCPLCNANRAAQQSADRKRRRRLSWSTCPCAGRAYPHRRFRARDQAYGAGVDRFWPLLNHIIVV